LVPETCGLLHVEGLAEAPGAESLPKTCFRSGKALRLLGQCGFAGIEHDSLGVHDWYAILWPTWLTMLSVHLQPGKM